MKFAFVIILVLSSGLALAKDVKDFNKVLIDDVQNDIENDNDQIFKKDNSPMRGPASVEVENEEVVPQEDSKIEKKVNQLGNTKW
jgi:hypothetical protein